MKSKFCVKNSYTIEWSQQGKTLSKPTASQRIANKDGIQQNNFAYSKGKIGHFKKRGRSG
jgi:hypothetical protein